MFISDLEYVQPAKSSVQGGQLLASIAPMAMVKINANLLGFGFALTTANVQLFSFSTGLFER